MGAGVPNSRLCAWQVLRRWSPKGTYAEDMVDRMAAQQQLSGPNRSLLNAIVLAVLRHRTLLDAWIDHLRDGGGLEDDAREWLRIGLVQLHIMGMPDHAAVNETVALAGRARGLVNAVLRRSLREKESLQVPYWRSAPWVVSVANSPVSTAILSSKGTPSSNASSAPT